MDVELNLIYAANWSKKLLFLYMQVCAVLCVYV